MNLRTMYDYVLSGKFKRFCCENNIDLKKISVEIKHYEKVLFKKDDQELDNVELFIKKSIESFIFGCYMLYDDDMLYSREYCIIVKDNNSQDHELY